MFETMEAVFWTLGPVPGRLLADLALPRPAALQALLADLDSGVATLTGPPGSGKSTLALQVAATLGRTAVVVSVPSLLDGELAATIDSLAAAPAPDRLLVLDGLAGGEEPAGREWARRAGCPAILIGDFPGTTPDPIPPGQASEFLRRRCQLAGVRWLAAALREAVALAAGNAQDLQGIGQACLYAAWAGERTRIDDETFLDGALAACSPPSLARARALGSLPDSRRELLKALIRYPDESPTDWARRCRMDPKAATVHLRRLERDDGLLVRSARGRYAVASPLVRLWLQAEHGTPVRQIGATVS